MLLYDEYANDSMNIHDIKMNFNECKSCWDCKDAWRHMINAALIEWEKALNILKSVPEKAF